MSESFGEKIRSLRCGKKYTLKELSEKTEIGITYLSKIEHDKVGSPNAKTIEKLSKALEAEDDVKQELFRLAKQVPPDLKDNIIKNKSMFEVFRSTQNLSAEELKQIVEEVKKRKNKNE